jgi:hypothetical protein
MCETVGCVIYLISVAEVSLVTLLILISVSAALKLPNPILSANSISIAMRS